MAATDSNNFKDVFISYGRRESKAFATKLHDRLVELGYKVWFDQNDIPLGVDFQNQIDEGIEKADNFIFVIAPHAVKSPYCLKEIVLAVKRNKRIIPLLQVEPTDCWDKMHPTVAKLNWIYMREKYEEGKALEELEAIDDFDAGFEGLASILASHKDYVKKHTEVLNLALDCENHQKTTEYLLTGKERQEAEDWLLTEFKDQQPPCRPTELHSAFLCESRKNAENLMTDVFISYAVEDKEIRTKVITALSRYLITTWLHSADIKKGENFGEAIDGGIEQADNFVFFISNESIVSEWCIKELEYAEKLQKRIIPLLIEEVDSSKIPPQVKDLQYIDFTDNTEHEDFEKDIDDILNELNRDKRYFAQHKVFLTQALKWERQDKNSSILLRGYNLQNAQAWMSIGFKRKIYKPTALHEEFIKESTAVAGEQSIEVFVSYSRKDGDFARRINEDLQLNGKTTWFDQDSIAEGSDFQTEIYKGIEASDNFVFIISPSSIESPYCADEVEYAANLGKRFITINHRNVDPSTMPPALASVQWIDFAKLDFHTGFSQLIRMLNTDKEHVQSHSKWQNRALEWDGKKRVGDLLLRGSEFTLAELWLSEAIEEKKKPAPTKLQKEYIEASNNAILALQAKEQATAETLKKRLRNSRIALVVAVFFLVAAFVGVIVAIMKSNEATKSAKEAQEQRIQAEANAEKAQKATEAAEVEAENARKAELIANEEKEKATKAQAKAQEEAIRAQEASERAKVEAENARKAEENAKAKTIIAQEQTKKAKEANAKAKYFLYVFNGKELAIRAINLEGNDELKAKLALTAYQLSEYAIRNLGDQIEGEETFDSEILEALQKAYLPYERDSLPKGEVWSMNALGNQVAYTNEKGNIRIAKLMAEKPKPYMATVSEIPWKNPDVFVRSMLFFNDSEQEQGIAFGTEDGRMLLTGKTGNDFITLDNAHEASVLSFLHLPEKNWLITTGKDAQMKVIDLANQQQIMNLQNDYAIYKLENILNKFILGIDESGKVLQWEIVDGGIKEEKHILYQHSKPLRSITYDVKNSLVAFGGMDGKVNFFTYQPGQKDIQVKSFARKHVGVISDLDFSSNGKWLASAGLGGKVFLWDLNIDRESFDKIVPVEINNNKPILSLSFDNRNKHLLFSDNEKLQIRTLDVNLAFEQLKLKSGNPQLSPQEWKFYIKGDISLDENETAGLQGKK